MNKKIVLTVALLLILCLNVLGVMGDISVGVKQGDWIEYNVTTTGNPPEEHNVTWARMEILHVQSQEVDVNVTTRARNGTVTSLLMTLNIEKGIIGAWWIIPANLNPGDVFYDAFLGQNITIKSQEEKAFADATRTVTNATVPTRTKLWDKSTGAFMVSMDELPDYTINVVAYSTNMWSAQVLRLDPTILYAIILVAVVAVVAVILLFVARRKKKDTF
jgi:hypothetical protein